MTFSCLFPRWMELSWIRNCDEAVRGSVVGSAVGGCVTKDSGRHGSYLATGYMGLPPLPCSVGGTEVFRVLRNWAYYQMWRECDSCQVHGLVTWWAIMALDHSWEGLEPSPRAVSGSTAKCEVYRFDSRGTERCLLPGPWESWIAL